MSQSASVTWEGLDELIRDLQNLPADLTEEARGIVERAADGAETQIRQEYAPGTGNLRGHLVQIVRGIGPFGVSIQLKNTAKHAYWWDAGTEARHYFGSGGTKHETGAMWGKRPPPWTFIRAAIKWRRWMYEALKAMLVRHGLTVSGSAEAA